MRRMVCGDFDLHHAPDLFLEGSRQTKLKKSVAKKLTGQNPALRSTNRQCASCRWRFFRIVRKHLVLQPVSDRTMEEIFVILSRCFQSIRLIITNLIAIIRVLFLFSPNDILDFESRYYVEFYYDQGVL